MQRLLLHIHLVFNSWKLVFVLKSSCSVNLAQWSSSLIFTVFSDLVAVLVLLVLVSGSAFGLSSSSSFSLSCSASFLSSSVVSQFPCRLCFPDNSFYFVSI